MQQGTQPEVRGVGESYYFFIAAVTKMRIIKILTQINPKAETTN